MVRFAGTRTAFTYAILSAGLLVVTTAAAISNVGASTAPGYPQVLLTQHGTGIASTRTFTVSKKPHEDVDIAWSFNCSNLKKPGYFNYSVVMGDKSVISDIGSSPGIPYLTSGSVNDYQNFKAGIYRLLIVSKCAWQIEVSQSQQLSP